MTLEPHRKLLRRAGIVLLSWAALDIGYNVYLLLTAQGFKLGSAVLVIIAGALLMRGDVRWAKWIAWVVALMLAWSMGSLLLVLPFSRPADLWIAQLRFAAGPTVMMVFMQVATAAVLFWLHRQLQHADVIAARRAAGQAATLPASAFILGVLLAVLTLAGLLAMQYGETGKKALLLAQQQHGAGYRYHVDAIRWSGAGATADVTAFNDLEIRNVQVAWSR